MVKVSIIIPVYNVEKYLNECIDSLLNQTFTDTEIICINDGSTDKSLEILESYADKIRLFTQKNKGQGSARNLGLDNAKGEYIYFMDADDVLYPTALEETINISQEKDLDFVFFKLMVYDENKNKEYTRNLYEMTRLGEKVKDKVFNYNDLGELMFDMAVSPVNKLYKKSFLDRFNVRFSEGIIFEDNIFFWEVFLNAQRIYFYQKHLYKRRIHDSSTTGMYTIRFADTLKVNNQVIDIFKKHGLFEKFDYILFNRKIKHAYMRYSMVNEDVQKEFFELIKKDFCKMNDEYENIHEVLTSKYSFILNNVINARGYEEFNYLMKNHDLNKHVKKIGKNNKKLKKDISVIKKENNDILNSRSWKYTGFLRKLKNSL